MLSTGCSGPPPAATPTTAPAPRAVAVTPVTGSDCGDRQRAAASTAYPALAPNDIYRVGGDELRALIIAADHDRPAVYPSGD